MDITTIANTAAANDTGDLPPLVAGRHLQADADIFAYECAHLEESLESNIDVLKIYIEQQRLMSGAEHTNLHLTLGKKAGRELVARLKEYQANRKDRDPELQARVRQLRLFMSTYTTPTVTPLPWKDREADDGMAQYQVDSINKHNGDISKSIIMTTDKDLSMVPGNHIHPHTYATFIAPNSYGELWIDETTTSKKVKGKGTAFFWAQLLMGDSADNIPGLPVITADMLNKYCPTKSILEAKTQKAKQAAMNKRKDGTIGPVKAYELLADCRNDKQAYRRVLELYTSYYGKCFRFTAWDGTPMECTATEMLLEQARLLWMQRSDMPDALDFFKEIANGKRGN